MSSPNTFLLYLLCFFTVINSYRTADEQKAVPGNEIRDAKDQKLHKNIEPPPHNRVARDVIQRIILRPARQPRPPRSHRHRSVTKPHSVSVYGESGEQRHVAEPYKAYRESDEEYDDGVEEYLERPVKESKRYGGGGRKKKIRVEDGEYVNDYEGVKKIIKKRPYMKQKKRRPSTSIPDSSEGEWTPLDSSSLVTRRPFQRVYHQHGGHRHREQVKVKVTKNHPLLVDITTSRPRPPPPLIVYSDDQGGRLSSFRHSGDDQNDYHHDIGVTPPVLDLESIKTLTQQRQWPVDNGRGRHVYEVREEIVEEDDSRGGNALPYGALDGDGEETGEETIPVKVVKYRGRHRYHSR